MFFGLLKSREEKTKEELKKRLHMDILSIANMVKTQVRYIMFFKKIDKPDLLDDDFFILYTFGAFDSIGAKYGLEIRRKIGPSIVEAGMVPLLSSYFEITETEAKNYLNFAFNSLSKTPIPFAISIGGTDGMALSQGQTPGGLISEYEPDVADEDPISNEVFLQFSEFCKQDIAKFS